jgi:hypothetical protein
MTQTKGILYTVVAVLVLIYLLPTILAALVSAAATQGVDAVIGNISPIVQIVAFVSPIGLLFMLWQAKKN